MGWCHCPDECGSEIMLPGIHYRAYPAVNHDHRRHPCYQARLAVAMAEVERRQNAVAAADQLAADLLSLQLREIERRLEDAGARMMRPYEHHNEMEAYVQ